MATISIDPSGYENGLKSASAKTSSFGDKLKELGKAVSDAQKTFAAIGTGIGAAGTAVFAFANKVSTTADNIDKMSQKMGLSAEAYQEWDFILTHCGTSVDGLQTSMKTLANAAADGTDSTKAALEKLGLSMDEVAAMSQEDLFSAVITGLQNMEEGTERTAIAADLLGRSATELGPVFNMTAEETESLRQQVHDLGGIMSNEAVKNGAAFQDALTDLKTSFSGVTNSMAEGLIPTLTDLMNNVAAFIGDGGLQGMIDKFIELSPIISAAAAAFVAYKAATAISGIISALTKATEGQTIAQMALNAVMNANPFVLVATLVAGVTAALVTLWNTNEGFREAVTEAWENVKKVISGAVDTIVTFFAETIPNGIQTLIDWFISIPQKAKDEMDKLRKNLSNAWESVKKTASDAWDSITSIFTNAWESIKNAWAGAKDWFKNKWEDIKSVFSDTLEHFRNVGANLLKGIWNGINDTVEWLRGKVKGVVDTIKGWFTGSEGFDEHSPSKWADNVADLVMRGFGIGFDRGENSLLRTVDGIIDDVMGRFDEMNGTSFRLGSIEVGSQRIGAVQTANVAFQDSAVGLSSAATVNAVSSATSSGQRPIIITKVMVPDGRVLAELTFDDLVNYGDSNGTPIVGRSYA